MDVHPEVSKARLQWLDWFEKIVLLAIYGTFFVRILSFINPAHLPEDLILNVPILIGEGLVVVFTLVRQKTDVISVHPLDWFLAFAATCLPMLVAPDPIAASWISPQLFGSLMLMAIGFQIYSKIALGRSFGLVAANRGLKLHGPYRLVRHPIYAGYLMMHITYLMNSPTLRNLLVYLLFYIFQLLRIAAEERLLTQNQQYQEYCRMVKYRLIPGLY